MTYAEVTIIVSRVKFLDRVLVVLEKQDGFLLQVRYKEADIDTGKVEWQHARKWYVSPYSTETEIVETAFLAIQRSMEHVVKEHFTYMGKRVYSPHVRIDARLLACAMIPDGREP